jgi:hypothetical protein
MRTPSVALNLLALGVAGLSLSGCLAASVAGAAVGVAGTAVGVTGKAVGETVHVGHAAVDAATGGHEAD